jgi:hypothetical protein
MDTAHAVYDSAMAGDADQLAVALSAAARLGEGSLLTALNESGWSALHCAAVAGDAQPVNMLLTAGARINVKSSPAEDTPLHFAARWDHRAVVDTLLSRGAFLDQTNAAAETPLHKACQYAAEAAVAELLQRGASCSLADSLGRTPLHVAAKHNAAAVVLQLLAAGADTDATDSRGRRPVELASGPTAVLLTPSSDDHATHVWLEEKGLLAHSDLFRAYDVTVDDLQNGLDEQRLRELGMPVGVRLKALKLAKALDATERQREDIGATSHGNAAQRPLGEVDWQMTEGGEWYRNNPAPLLSGGNAAAGAADAVPLQVIDPWDYDETEWTQKYGQRDSPASGSASGRSKGSPAATSPQPQPEPEPEPEPVSPSLKTRAPPLPKKTSSGSPGAESAGRRQQEEEEEEIDVPWENDSDDDDDDVEAADQGAGQQAAEEDDGVTVRPWFRRAVTTD